MAKKNVRGPGARGSAGHSMSDSGKGPLPTTTRGARAPGTVANRSGNTSKYLGGPGRSPTGPAPKPARASVAPKTVQGSPVRKPSITVSKLGSPTGKAKPQAASYNTKASRIAKLEKRAGSDR